MGKAQKKKAMRRHNPVRVPDSHLPHGLASASSSSSKQQAILPIIQKLASIDTVERIWACAAVSNLIQNDPSTRRLLQGKNIVGELITRLSDASDEVVVEAAGALRNLCIDGGYDICAEMYNKNIMAPLRTFPAKISTTLQQFLQDPKLASEGARIMIYGFAENIITIFWCLSETSNKALKAVNDTNLVPFLISFLQVHEQLSLTTVNAAAQCLYVLTEDNDSAIAALRSESLYLTCLLELAQKQACPFPNDSNNETRWTMLRVLAAGILRNISPLPSIVPASSIDLERIVTLPLLIPQLSIELYDIAVSVASLLPQLPDKDITTTKPSLQHTPGSDHKTEVERQLDFVEERLRVTQLALEILTSVCAKLPDPESIVEGTVPEYKDDTIDDDIEENEDATIQEFDKPHINGSDNALTTKRESNKDIVAALAGPLLKLIRPTPLSFPPNPTEPSPHPPITSALSIIHVRALECLNNLFLAVEEAETFSREDKEGTESFWNDIWGVLQNVGSVVDKGKIVDVRGFERKKEIWDNAMGVLWGIARIGRGYIVPHPDQVQSLMEFCDASDDELTRVKCLGALECVSQSQSVQAVELNKIIGTYLIDQIASPISAHTESCLQAASALIDIYSDETSQYDINFRDGRWVGVLEKTLPFLRKLVKGIDRRKPGGLDLRIRGDEVVTNLAAFIRYRRNLRLD